MRRINLFGGPHSGKSTNAAFLYYHMKTLGHNIDMVREHAMTWVYEKKEMTYFDEISLFSTQLHNEDVMLRGGVDILVADCPIMLTVTYAYYMKCKYWGNLAQIAADFESAYPSINIFLVRNDAYSEKGRLHSKKEAIEVDEAIKFVLKSCGYHYVEIDIDDNDGLLSYVSNFKSS